MKTVVQQVYEYILRAQRMVTSREVMSALPEANHSSVSFALTRLVRDGSLERVGYGQYRATALPGDERSKETEQDGAYLADLFETIRPALNFRDLAFLYEIVGVTRRLLPEAFREARDRGRPRNSEP
jgi:predicted transcriptional regulator of viral defense system